MINDSEQTSGAHVRALVRRHLPKLARLHWKNWRADRRTYPQLWYCWPIKRRTPMRRALEWVCGKLSGHELSKTEWGYGGGKFVDRNCRWCDKVIQVPKAEDDPPNDLLKGLANEMGYDA